MPAANYNFLIEQSSDFIITFQYTDENGVSVDLTDSCVKLRYLTNNQIRGIFTNGLVDGLSPNLITNGYELTTTNTGFIILRLASALTSTYTFDNAVYDLDVQFDITDINGTRISNTRVATGTITIVKKYFPSIIGCDISSGELNITPTPTPAGSSPTPTPTPAYSTDLCFPECIDLDVYSVVYTGSSMNIPDNNICSGIISTSDSRSIENVEVAINGLRHNSPQDLTFILAPPNGNKILLSSHNKIGNYNPGFSFMFSNKATAGNYLNNIYSGGVCSILDKTSSIKFQNSSLEPGFNHLFGSSTTGNWTLYIKDDDPGVSGSIDSWKLIITYLPE
jgi:subtilisin-like proprotein convertase family protein